MHKLVINIVERSLVVLVPLTLRLPGSETAAVVGIGLERSQLGESIVLSLEGDLCRGEQFFILLGQIVFLLKLRDYFGGEGFEVDLGVYEH